ncbi:hypothetical protein AVEN_82387-1 [Araneus ventricosus]|uniref:Uncharacterized protein n=1 Tax=Araneus ventricosus TaxID=182803 RepID=A0A4Y2JYD0_ARAVE|nr:hypothetical protein AVEN_171394-1 [Araneus ventricosus]GBM94508.1 hypothetical protein AVEN_82387-1 [Araneus ventricosus]
MPWKEDHESLPDSYELSLKRLDYTTKKIGYLEAYHQVSEGWLLEGITKNPPKGELSSSYAHYLPSHPVIKDKSSTSSMKIRPVFDASAKTHNHPSLNDCLEIGLNLIEAIPSVSVRFRLGKIGVISDMKRALLEISLEKRD